jgi:F-type H+-transporting ATPase subunit delta
MPGTPAARRYAKALLGLAKVQRAEETVGTALSQVASTLADPELAKVLQLPTLPLKARKDIVEQLVASLSLQPPLSNFLRILAENDRLSAVGDIQRAYQHLLEQALGRVRAKVKSAAPLADNEIKALVEAFSQLTKKTIVPVVEIDPTLLGGVVVEVEGQVYDASLKTQLRRMGEALVQQL